MGEETVKNLALLKAKQPHVSLSAHLGLLFKVGTLLHIHEPPKFYVVSVAEFY